MARIVIGSYMIRYPLGGNLSWALQYLVGFHRLGHDVYLAERSGYENDCYDPVKDVMSDDPTSGIKTVDELLRRFGLEDRWCFVDASGDHRGMSKTELKALLDSADLFIDMGAHGTWQAETTKARHRALFDGEPAFTQMKMENRLAKGEVLPEYDSYHTCGQNIGTDQTSAPTAGKSWNTLFHPVVVELFSREPLLPDSSFTTVMNWQSYEPLHFEGRIYGHKDVEFERFIDLPRRTNASMEAAVHGKAVPRDRLTKSGWRLREAHAVTTSFDSFTEYIARSKGEFTVCKNGFVATRSGWFSDRSAIYLAHGRPVIMQETGFSAHLPCGQGLFAIEGIEDAAAAIEQVEADYGRHSERAREIASEFLDASKVLGRFLDEIGI